VFPVAFAIMLLPSRENPSHNAYRHRYVTVYYRWHPLCGQRLEYIDRRHVNAAAKYSSASSG